MLWLFIGHATGGFASSLYNHVKKNQHVLYKQSEKFAKLESDQKLNIYEKQKARQYYTLSLLRFVLRPYPTLNTASNGWDLGTRLILIVTICKCTLILVLHS